MRCDSCGVESTRTYTTDDEAFFCLPCYQTRVLEPILRETPPNGQSSHSVAKKAKKVALWRALKGLPGYRYRSNGDPGSGCFEVMKPDGNIYVIRRDNCECPGWQFNRKCKHHAAMMNLGVWRR